MNSSWKPRRAWGSAKCVPRDGPFLCGDFQSPWGLQTTAPIFHGLRKAPAVAIAKRPCGTKNCRCKELRLARKNPHTHFPRPQPRPTASAGRCCYSPGVPEEGG